MSRFSLTSIVLALPWLGCCAASNSSVPTALHCTVGCYSRLSGCQVSGSTYTGDGGLNYFLRNIVMKLLWLWSDLVLQWWSGGDSPFTKNVKWIDLISSHDPCYSCLVSGNSHSLGQGLQLKLVFPWSLLPCYVWWLFGPVLSCHVGVIELDWSVQFSWPLFPELF